MDEMMQMIEMLIGERDDKIRNLDNNLSAYLRMGQR